MPKRRRSLLLCMIDPHFLSVLSHLCRFIYTVLFVSHSLFLDLLTCLHYNPAEGQQRQDVRDCHQTVEEVGQRPY